MPDNDDGMTHDTMPTDEEMAARPQDISDVNWAEHSTVAGLEHLGRAIVDANGQPSGSYANFENLRGITGEQPLRPVADVVTSIAQEIPVVPGMEDNK